MPTDETSPVMKQLVGGQDAKENEFPSQLSLQVQQPGEPITYRHVCAATVLNQHWAVTAAHCLADRTEQVASLSVVCGSSQLYEGGTRHRLQAVVIHPGFDVKTANNDIALVKVAEPFALDGVRVAAATLPQQGQAVPDDAVATVVGWGRLQEVKTPPPKRLQKAQLRIVNQAVCRREYKGSRFPVRDSNVCAGVMQGGIGVCRGDSGGPLLVDGVLVGVTSFGSGCARPYLPHVFTRIASYVDWIAQTAQ